MPRIRSLLALGLIGAGILLLAPGAAVRGRAAEPLNLLLITADDLNGDSMGWMGSKQGATPQLDRFAQNCFRLEQAHVSAPICQPSRSALMTGRVPHRNGALGFGPIRTDIPTLPELLHDAGYFTAALNKTVHMTPRAKFPWDLALDGTGKNPTALGAQVTQAIRTAGERNRPFFLNANITDPHRPFYGSARARMLDGENEAGGKEAEIQPYTPQEITVPSFLEDLPPVRQEVAQYFSSVRRLDRSFAALLSALESSGKAENTAVLFMSDHGMSFPFSKATVYRNGTWTPLLLRWPGMGKPTVLKEEMVSSVDIMPTLLEILGVKTPAGLDGRSFLPLLRGEKQPDRDWVITHVNTVSSGRGFPGRCIRTRTRSYMYHSWPDGTTRFRVEAMGGLSWNAINAAGATDPRIAQRARQYVLRTREEYFDLEKDPDERRNLIDDPTYLPEIQKARQRLLGMMDRTEDPLLEGFRLVARKEPSN